MRFKSLKTHWRRRHPTDRRPMWLQQLDAEIRYWLRRTSRLRHSEPFNKRAAGHARRQARAFKRTNQEELLS